MANNHSPSYWIRKKLLRNKPAVGGLIVISIAVLCSLFTFLIIPDATPNINDGNLELRKKQPGFKANLLRIRKNKEVEDVGFFNFLSSGQESSYLAIPFDSLVLTNNSGIDVYVFEGRGKLVEHFDLVDVFFPVDKEFHFEDKKNYKVENEQLIFRNVITAKNQSLQLSEVKSRLQDHIEERTFLLGTDKAGRDLYSRLVYGTRVSLSIGLIAVSISLVMGVIIGAIGGFFGGWIDEFIVWFITVVWSIPGIMLVIAISLALQSKGIWVAFVAVGLTMWVEVARIVRGQIMELREKPFVEAAKVLGVSDFRIIFRHILPNIIGPIIVVCTANFAAAILVEAGLSFLGLGVQPPTPSWGMMVHEGYKMMTSEGAWYLLFFPSISISILVLAFNLLGNGLRDAFDPKGTH